MMAQDNLDNRVDDFMGEALALARQAMASGEVPVGAVIVNHHTNRISA